jgi:hypothetical protein
VYGHANGLGLKKSEAYMKSVNAGKFTGESGKQHRFKKGQTPWNKGQHYNPRNGGTRFTEGHKPKNTKHDGAVTIRTDDGREYKYIRISEGNWMLLHVKNWIDANGPVPDGMIVVFKKPNIPDRENISNLELITRAENMKRNTWHQWPPELKNAIRTLNKLKKQLNESK